jgi:AbrB family looped-hinge helix DNA binding protein
MNSSVYMKIGDRGQVVIPKEMRERYGLLPNTEVEFSEERGHLILRPAPRPSLPQRDAWDDAWGVLRDKVKDIDQDLEEMRGR